MKSKVEISKIVVEVGGKKIELSVDDAKKLKDLLNDIFGQPIQPINLGTETIKEIHHYDYPIYIDRTPYNPPMWGNPEITCVSNQNILNCTI